MSDLTEFLLARIDEAEQMIANLDNVEWMGDRAVDAKEFARADARAKRRIVDDRIHLDTVRPGAARAHSEWACRTLAAVYADHPDYDEAWRP